MSHRFYGCVVACMLAGCVPVQEKSPLAPETTITLHTDWPFSLKWSGVYTAPQGGDELIFSGDPNTFLKVRVFSAQGDSLYDIPLDAAADSLGEINSLVLFAPDSIFAIEEHGPRFIVVDRQGHVVRKGSLEESLCDPNGDFYQVSGYFSGMQVTGNALYLTANWWSACTDKRTSTTLDEWKCYYAGSARNCTVARLELHTFDSLTFGASDILPQWTDTPRYMVGVGNRFLCNGNLMMTSDYSGSIMRVDQASLQVTFSPPIQLAGKPVGITPPPVTEQELRSDAFQIRIATKAEIASLGYDPATGHYLAAVHHEVPEDTPEEDCYRNRPWSLIVLDSALNQTKTYEMPGKAYWPGSILNTNQGTWILAAQSGPAGSRLPKVFHHVELP